MDYEQKGEIAQQNAVPVYLPTSKYNNNNYLLGQTNRNCKTCNLQDIFLTH